MLFNYLLKLYKKIPNIQIPNYILKIDSITLIKFQHKELCDISYFGDGSYSLYSPNILTFGRLIKELRTEQKIAQSTLSKIENDHLQPEIAVSQALLQRLGVCDNIFSFYGNKHETQLYNFRDILIHSKISNREENIKILHSMESLITDKDILYKQYILFKKAVYTTNTNEKIVHLNNALSLTLSNFNIDQILKYRLSWLELTILNSLALAYSYDLTSTVGMRYFYRILDYLTINNIDLLFKQRIAPITVMMLFSRLFQQNRFSEIVDLKPFFAFSSSCISCDTYVIANAYTHFSQALGELKKTNTMKLYANYAYSCYDIYNDISTATDLYNSIENEFSVKIF